ncbi:MAG TPA: hypothetical protein VK821_10915, partial [Dehalococcoidia bacterium]|nr:hypothetical protein [Dehalococcoidia bacterium]
MSSASDEVLTCEKAGFGIRVGATLIDWTILRVGYAVLVAVIGAVFPSRPAPAGAEFLSSLVLPLMLWTLSIGYFLF